MPISANPGLNFNPGFFDGRSSRNGRGPLFGRCSLGRDLLLVLLSLLFMQLSKIQHGVWLFSGEMTLPQRLKNLGSFWAFRSFLSVKEGNLFSSIKSTFFLYKKFSCGYLIRCAGRCQNRITYVCFCLNPI